jgi:hypothetical protein
MLRALRPLREAIHGRPGNANEMPNWRRRARFVITTEKSTASRQVRAARLTIARQRECSRPPPQALSARFRNNRCDSSASSARAGHHPKKWKSMKMASSQHREGRVIATSQPSLTAHMRSHCTSVRVSLKLERTPEPSPVSHRRVGGGRGIVCHFKRQGRRERYSVRRIEEQGLTRHSDVNTSKYLGAATKVFVLDRR